MLDAGYWMLVEDPAYNGDKHVFQQRSKYITMKE